jgi:CRP/FNR family cyclic AMP-dependent transcriptional regulator
MPISSETLSELKFFKLTDDEDRKQLLNILGHLKLDQGQILFEKGDPGDRLFIVLEGKVELFIRTVAGEKIVLTVVGQGDMFGEISMSDQGPRTATAVGLEKTELIVLTREDLLLFFRKRPDAAIDMIAAMASMIRKADDLLRTRVSRNVNEEVEETLTPLQRIADWIAWFSGSMPFLAVNTVWFAGWIAINTWSVGISRFDPYPFGLLTMIVSLEAIFLSIFVLISQNRQAEKDRVRSNVDYEVNVKAELEVAHLHDKTDRMQERMLEQFEKLKKMIAEEKGKKGAA